MSRVEENEAVWEITKMIDLWSAVLEQAVDEYVRLVKRRKALGKAMRYEAETALNDVRHWLFEDDEMRVGSYFWVCTVIQADPYGFRNRVLSLTR